MKRLSFQEAARPSCGWAHAPNDSDYMLYARAETLAIRCCLNHKAIYHWAVKHNNDLIDFGAIPAKGASDHPLYWPFFDAVVNDLPVDNPIKTN